MHKALKQNSSVFSRYYLNEDFNEIKFDFELVDDIIVGENFRFGLNRFVLTLTHITCDRVGQNIIERSIKCSAKRESDDRLTNNIPTPSDPNLFRSFSSSSKRL